MKSYKTSCFSVVNPIIEGRSNAFVVSTNGMIILIDCSTGRVWAKLKRRLKKLNIEKIDFLILTHSHFDHAANSARIKREYGAKVIINKAEASFLEKGESIIPHGTNFLTKFIVNTFSGNIASGLTYEPCIPDVLVDERLDLKEFGINVYITKTPWSILSGFRVL